MNVLQVSNGVPVYDLAGDEIRIQSIIRTANSRLPFTVSLNVPTEDDLIDLIRARNMQIKPAADDVNATETERINSLRVDCDFFDKHVKQVRYGKNRDVVTDAQFAKFDPMFQIRQSTIIFLLSATPEMDNSAPADLTEPSLEELLERKTTVTMKYAICDDNDVEHVFQAKFTFRDPTAEESIQWQRHQKIRRDRANAQAIIIDHKMISKLYAAMVESVEGFNGNIKNVPYPFKFGAVNQVFKGAERKNV